MFFWALPKIDRGGGLRPKRAPEIASTPPLPLGSPRMGNQAWAGMIVWPEALCRWPASHIGGVSENVDLDRDLVPRGRPRTDPSRRLHVEAGMRCCGRGGACSADGANSKQSSDGMGVRAKRVISGPRDEKKISQSLGTEIVSALAVGPYHSKNNGSPSGPQSMKCF
jgi:hypothetical protein